MKAIQMVDLQGQYQRIKSEIDLALQQVLDEARFINGPQVASFQQELALYTGAQHVVTCGNGTDALQIALMALDLKPGDEVITTPFTFVATVEVITLLGLKPVFVDVCWDTFNMDVRQLDTVLTERTKAIIPVHLFGQCADMEEILAFARKYDLFVVEDACQAIGSTVRFSDGSIKQVEVTSCGPNDGPLTAKGTYEARIACNLNGKKEMVKSDDAKKADKNMELPFFTQSGKDRECDGDQYIANMKDGSWCGFKNFDFKGDESRICVQTRGTVGGVLRVYTDRNQSAITEINLPAGDVWTNSNAEFSPIRGVTPLFFEYNGNGSIDFNKFTIEQ